MSKLRIAYLATDVYGGRGGIALYNRDVLASLVADDGVGQPIVLPRIVGNGADAVPDAVDWRPGDSGSLPAYIFRALQTCLRDGPFDLIYCGHTNLLPVAALMKRMTGAPILLAIYGVEAWTPFLRRAARHGLKSVDHCLTISEYTSARFRSWSGFAKDKMTLVPNAIHLDQFGMGPKRADLVEKYGLADKSVVMIFGRMDALELHKGFDEIIEAMPGIIAQRPNARLVLAGDGDGQPGLQNKATALGLADHVIFTGEVPEAEKADYFRLADAYVMPSRQEGFGFVHLEAMACGIPAVASIADGSREAVREGMIGKLVDPGDRASIVKTTLAALDVPKHVPEGLSYFEFDAFARRLNDCVRLVATQRRIAMA